MSGMIHLVAVRFVNMCFFLIMIIWSVIIIMTLVVIIVSWISYNLLYMDSEMSPNKCFLFLMYCVFSTMLIG